MRCLSDRQITSASMAQLAGTPFWDQGEPKANGNPSFWGEPCVLRQTQLPWLALSRETKQTQQFLRHIFTEMPWFVQFSMPFAGVLRHRRGRLGTCRRRCWLPERPRRGFPLGRFFECNPSKVFFGVFFCWKPKEATISSEF